MTLADFGWTDKEIDKQTDGQTDRRTDGQKDRQMPLYGHGLAPRRRSPGAPPASAR